MDGILRYPTAPAGDPGRSTDGGPRRPADAGAGADVSMKCRSGITRARLVPTGIARSDDAGSTRRAGGDGSAGTWAVAVNPECARC